MWARNGRWILPEMPDFHVAFRNLLHAVNLRHGTDGFTSPPNEGVLRIFSPWKIRRLRPGLNPRTWVPKASTLPLDHRNHCLNVTLCCLVFFPVFFLLLRYNICFISFSLSTFGAFQHLSFIIFCFAFWSLLFSSVLLVFCFVFLLWLCVFILACFHLFYLYICSIDFRFPISFYTCGFNLGRKTLDYIFL